METEHPVPRSAALTTRATHPELVMAPAQQKQKHQPKEPQAAAVEPDWSCLQVTDGRLRQLYGRDRELTELRQAFHRRLLPRTNTACTSTASTTCTDAVEEEPSSELILLSGRSGTGKSVLAQAAFQTLVAEHGGYYVVGKFDQLQVPEPYAPYVAALTEWVLLWETTQGTTRLRQETMGQRLANELGTDNCAVLQALIPALARILRVSSSAHNTSTTTTTKDANQQPESDQMSVSATSASTVPTTTSTTR